MEQRVNAVDELIGGGNWVMTSPVGTPGRSHPTNIQGRSIPPYWINLAPCVIKE